MTGKRLRNANGRSTAEWIGASPDSVPPPRVRLRVLARHDYRCHLTGALIHGDYGVHWQVDHVIALTNGGMNRESNLAPALTEPHKAKTAADRKVKAKGDRIIKRQYGLRKPSQRPMPGSKASPWKRQYNREKGKFETVRRGQ